jgi:hypothetical protein
MDVLIQEVEKHWAIIVTVGSAIFFLYKIRAEETLRTRLKLINECYLSLALINDAIQDWAQPIIQTTVEDHDRLLMERIQNEMPEAHKYFHQASVLMRPETARAIKRIFVLFGLLRAEYTNWQMFKNNGAGYVDQTLKAFNNTKKKIPAEIEKTLYDVLTDFQILVNGSTAIVLWKATRRVYPSFRSTMNHNLLTRFEQDRKDLISWLK